MILDLNFRKIEKNDVKIAKNSLAIGLQENGGGKRGRFERPRRGLSTNVNILQDCCKRKAS